MGYKFTWKKIGSMVLILLLLILALKLFMFYIPFFIAYLISLLIEPAIKLLNKKTNFTRKTCSIIVIIILFGLIIGLLIGGSIVLVSESSNLLSMLNEYLDIMIKSFKSMFEKIDLNRFNLSSEIKNLIENSTTEILNKIIDIIKNILNSFLEILKSLPKVCIYIIITVLATYFITSDKFYIRDTMEHHIPKKIIGKILEKTENINKSFGKYLKAELTIVGINFLIVLMGLNIFYLIGMDVGYPLLMALLIAFVDALPILGAGTIMIPWSIFLILNKMYSVGFSILGLYILILAIRQFLEPKIVSNKIGVHPIFTLIAMYTGFKIMGVIGLLIGPIILIILKNIFENTIDEGIFKYLLE